MFFSLFLYKALCLKEINIAKAIHLATWMVLDILTYDLGQGVAIVVDDDRGLLQGFPEIEHRLHGQGGHVRFGPPLSSLLHNFFIFHPPTNSAKWLEYSFNHNPSGLSGRLGSVFPSLLERHKKLQGL